MLSNYFNGFNEGIIGGEAETRGFMVRCGERPFAVRGNPREAEIPVKLPMNDGAMKTVECIWIDIWCMLDWVIGLCQKTAEMYFPGMSSSTSECIK